MGSVSDGFLAGSPAFYPPLLDDDGLTGIVNCDETQNLLVYAPASDVNANTYNVLTDYFQEPVYIDFNSNDKYRKVADATSVASSVYGHLVEATLTNGKLTATNDHLLVDKQDFNCPIAYSFDGSHRMWYQRKPENQEYVDLAKGWQGISIPFTAELVTTNDKGEITHFYSGSESSKNGTGSKIGHEYWLREFKEGGTTEGNVYKANMSYPDATAGTTKTVTNTFLWDYYYKANDRKDENSDIYQEYYSNNRTYSGYPYLAGAKPYIIGLPSDTYYEFDLSGSFVAQNTKTSIDKLGQQTITFASAAGAAIGVSDTELSETGSVAYGGYTFKANYMSKELAAYPATPEAGKTYNTNYVLNAEGSSYDLVTTTTTKAVPFRPYFTGTITAPSGSRPYTRSIVFSGDGANMSHKTSDNEPGSLMIYAGKKSVVVESDLRHDAEVRITTTSGVTLATFTIQPGETIETRVNLAGVYIVQTTDGEYTKKLAVK